jgi:hypothetical protein
MRGSADVLVEVVSGQDQDSHVRISSAHQSSGLDPRHAGQPDVQEHDCGTCPVNEGDSLFRCAGLTHDLDVRLVLQTRPNPLPEHLVVVDD